VLYAKEDLGENIRGLLGCWDPAQFDITVGISFPGKIEPAVDVLGSIVVQILCDMVVHWLRIRVERDCLLFTKMQLFE